MSYDPRVVEPHWQAYWEREGTFVAVGDGAKPKFYALDMFPYPSGKGLHVGHPASYIATDVLSRKRRAQGYDVLHPMGYDAFGLPAEQKAIDEGIPPQESTEEAIDNFRRQLKMCGFSYDWTRELSTASPDFYRWTQWIFTKLIEHNLAYESDTFVNWCPALGTVLANDEVIDGKSERGGHPVERRRMKQWMIRITKFAESLLAGLDTIDWPEMTKTGQRERIGRSEGAEINFKIAGGADESIKVFTTRPDTLWGATYMVVAPEHPIVGKITRSSQRAEVEKYQKRVASMSEIDRQTVKDKTGIDTGARVLHPATQKEIPVWISDYVIYGYGTGAIMAVPAHDVRDYAFASEMGLPIVEVVSGGDVSKEAHVGEGALINSGPLDGVPTQGGEAKKKAISWLIEHGHGEAKVTYKLRDWTFARQRYWGEPIPVLKSETGDFVRALKTNELPVVLPEVERYAPTGDGDSPLAVVRQWIEVEDPETGKKLFRETHTMPGSAGSSWYFLRYCDPRNQDAFCSRAASDFWMPVDLYVGGPEHTVGHLMYSRMWHRFLYEIGEVRDPEPFVKLRHQGMIQGFTYYEGKRVVPHEQVEERDGQPYKKGTDIALDVRIEKMSKRKGNVVNPDEVIQTHGADAMRVYIAFLGPHDQDKPWAPQGIEAQASFLRRFWRLYFDENNSPKVTDGNEGVSEQTLKVLHKTIAKVSADIEDLALNTAISALHVATRDLTQLAVTSRSILEPLCQLLAPFAPHICEEIWEKGLGHSGGISYAAWPQADESLTKDSTIKMGVQVMGKTRGEIELAPDADQTTALALAQANPAVAKFIEGKTLVKVIYKPGKILNLVAK